MGQSIKIGLPTLLGPAAFLDGLQVLLLLLVVHAAFLGFFIVYPYEFF